MTDQNATTITGTDAELARITRYIEEHPEDANVPYGELLARDIQVYDRIIAQCDQLLALATDADVDALIDETFGKPSVAVEASAGLFDTTDVEAELDDYAADIADREFFARGMW